MEKRCELYLRVPAGALPARDELDAIVRQVMPAAILVTGDVGSADRERLRELIEAAQRQNIATLIEDDPALAIALRADGIHTLADSEKLAAARGILGGEKSIGASCVLSRHEAMSMAEDGADYVAFGERDAGTGVDADELVEMIGWWGELFEVPCVAWFSAEMGTEGAAALVEAGADFLAVPPSAAGRAVDIGWLADLAALVRAQINPA